MIIRLHHLRLTFALSLAASLTSSCGTDDAPKGKNSADAQEASESDAMDHAAVPPKEYYDALMEKTLGNLDSLALSNAPQVVWLNFNGGTVARGYGSGQSFLLCKSSATIPASSVSAADQTAIVEKVKSHYDKAGANLVITLQKPASGDFTTMYVGGSYSDLGCTGSNVLGMAPIDSGNLNRNDIAFTFTQGVQSTKIISDTIAHEAAHSFGLNHTTNKVDLMYPSLQQTAQNFAVGPIYGGSGTQDGPAILKSVLGNSGTPSNPSTTTPSTTTPSTDTTTTNTAGSSIPNLSNLGSLDILKSLGKLIPGLGQGQSADISSILPQLKNLLPSSLSSLALPGLDKILTIFGIASGNSGSTGTSTGTGGTGGLGDLSSLTSIFTNLLSSSSLSNLASLGGFGDIGSALGSIQNIFKMLPIMTLTTADNTITTVPDLANLLRVSNLDRVGLLTSLSNCGRAINKDYTGETRDALLSFVKVAHAQAYRNISDKP